MTTMAKPSSTRDRAFLALLLLTAGVLVLLGRFEPLEVAGDAVALALGLELLCWAGVARSESLLIAGGVLTGVGTAILLVSGPLEGAGANTTGGTFILAVAAGFALVAVLSPSLAKQRQTWAWITAAAVGGLGAAVLAGPSVVSGFFNWAIPLVLLVGGVVVAAGWWRASRR